MILSGFRSTRIFRSACKYSLRKFKHFGKSKKRENGEKRNRKQMSTVESAPRRIRRLKAVSLFRPSRHFYYIIKQKQMVVILFVITPPQPRQRLPKCYKFIAVTNDWWEYYDKASIFVGWRTTRQLQSMLTCNSKRSITASTNFLQYFYHITQRIKVFQNPKNLFLAPELTSSSKNTEQYPKTDAIFRQIDRRRGGSRRRFFYFPFGFSIGFQYVTREK